MNSVSAANKSRPSDNVLAESLMVCPIYKKKTISLNFLFKKIYPCSVDQRCS